MYDYTFDADRDPPKASPSTSPIPSRARSNSTSSPQSDKSLIPNGSPPTPSMESSRKDINGSNGIPAEKKKPRGWVNKLLGGGKRKPKKHNSSLVSAPFNITHEIHVGMIKRCFETYITNEHMRDHLVRCLRPMSFHNDEVLFPSKRKVLA